MFFAKKYILSHEGYQELSFQLWRPEEANQYPGACTQYKIIFTHPPFSKSSQVILNQISNPTKAKTKTNKQANKSPNKMRNNKNNTGNNNKETLLVKTVSACNLPYIPTKDGVCDFPCGKPNRSIVCQCSLWLTP